MGEEKGELHVFFYYQKLNSLCQGHHYVNTELSANSVIRSIELEKYGILGTFSHRLCPY